MAYPITKLLIANRGEIAVRIIRTAKRLGIATVAVYSDPDSNSLFVRLADESVPLNGIESKDTYLNQSKILEACRLTGADAVHPGYGFLSEKADFAELLEQNKISFIGPSSESIRSMGDKIGSRKLVEKSGVPVIPGYDRELQDSETFTKEAKRIGLPLMVKASAGGGGKGMRRVDSFDQLESAIQGAKREALSAFGDDRLLLEKYIENPRHIEFQVFGDSKGKIIHLHERDCSLQRRHQKVVEETPAPHLPKEVKEKMAKAAIEAARAVDYLGAGTVEFIYGATGDFYFLEMNTRLQVEHPVTEMTTGWDLVEWQIRVARGEQLPDTPPQIGHAIEVRIYAEDADNGFLPAIGTIENLHFPQGTGIRIDSGIEEKTEINMYYDPMLAKVICHGESRAEALAVMKHFLEKSYIFGLTTNISFLRRVVEHPRFVSGHITTHLIAEELNSLQPKFSSLEKERIATELAMQKKEVNPWKTQSANSLFSTSDSVYSMHRETVWVHCNGEIWHYTFKQNRTVTKGIFENEIKSPMPGKVVQVFAEIGKVFQADEPLLVLEAMKMENVIKASEVCIVRSVFVSVGDAVKQDGILLELEAVSPKKT